MIYVMALSYLSAGWLIGDAVRKQIFRNKIAMMVDKAKARTATLKTAEDVAELVVIILDGVLEAIS